MNDSLTSKKSLSMFKLLPSFLLVMVCTMGCANAQLEIQGLSIAAGAGSAEPRLTKGPDGTIILSWQEPHGEQTQLRFSRLRNAGWGGPQLVAQGDNWFVNWADYPSVLPVSENLWAAHWLSKRPGGIYAYDVALSLSTDEGLSWGDQITPHRDNTATEHGFVSLYPADNGVGVVWLDGRYTAAAGSGHAHSGQSSDAGMTLRHAVVAADGTLTEEFELDNLVCDCCQTSVAIASGGPVAVYRNRSEEEIRDIYITRYVDGKWLAGKPVSNDGWKIAGCPVNGPVVAADGDTVVVAWFTVVDDLPLVRFARSIDAGQTFGIAKDVDNDGPAGRVGLVLLDNGDAIISWLGKGENGVGDLNIQRIGRDGSSGPVHTLVSTGQGRAAGVPQIQSDGKNLIVAWTDISEQASQVRSMRIILPEADK